MDVSFWTRLIVTKKNTIYNEMSFFDVQQSLDSKDSNITNKNSNLSPKIPENRKKKVRFSNDVGPAYPNCGNIHERLQTFKRLSWPPGISQKPYDLAHAGFFYTGLNDEVTCFYCGENVRHWKAEDDPLMKHDKISPNCNFMKILDLDETEDVIPSAIYIEEIFT